MSAEQGTLVVALMGLIVWFLILHLVVRSAVTNGILKADRMRAEAEAERQLVKAQTEREQAERRQR